MSHYRYVPNCYARKTGLGFSNFPYNTKSSKSVEGRRRDNRDNTPRKAAWCIIITRCAAQQEPELSSNVTYTSGHESVDTERLSCLMNTPLEHCVKRFPSFPLQRAVAVSVPLAIPRFQVWGSNPQSRQFFRFFSFSQLSATVNQWRIFLAHFID